MAQPEASFAGQPFYPKISTKAAALGFSLIQNPAFLDGNKRVGHTALEVFLILNLNGYELDASVGDQERIVLGVASGQTSKMELAEWLSHHIVER